MNRKILIMTASFLSIVGYLGGCAQSTGSGQPSTEVPTTATPSRATRVPPRVGTPVNVIYVNQEMRYADSRMISSAVLTECRLPQQGVELLETAARGAGFNLVRDDQAVRAGRGRTLQVEIANVAAGGNAFIGHFKQVSVTGRLLEDGREVGNFHGTRSSMGGAFAAFKGSCSVLGRCLDTLTKDITVWLKNPGKDSRIGQ